VEQQSGRFQARERGQLVDNADKVFQPQQIVLAHANLPTITHCYPQLLDLIHSRNLQAVTLNDVAG
jgi:peptidoglycan-N-acetylglucosamine deacetylase